MTANSDRLVAQYMRRLKRELAAVPRARRHDLMQEISDHIAQGRAELPDDENDAQLRALLDRIGDPSDIAAEARGHPDAPDAPMTAAATVLRILALVVLAFMILGIAIALASANTGIAEKAVLAAIGAGLLVAAMRIKRMSAH